MTTLIAAAKETTFNDVLDYSTQFVLICHVLTGMVRVIEGQII